MGTPSGPNARGVIKALPCGGSLFELRLPAPLGVEPWRRCPVRRSLGVRMNNGCRSSATGGLPAARHPYQAGANKLTRGVKTELASTLSPGRRCKHLIEGKTAFRSRTPQDAARHTPERRRAAAPALRPALPAVGRTSVRPLGPARARDEGGEGETTASEWSFPRRGCRGNAPRSDRLVCRPPRASERERRQRAATVSLATMHCAAGPERGGHHAVVSSSLSTFPRHWAWSHGAGTLGGARLHCGGEAVAAAAPHTGCRRHGIRTKRVVWKLTRADSNSVASGFSRGQRRNG